MPDQPAPVLELRDVHARYDRIPAVCGIDLQLAPGTTGCLIGANGAGKSTTLAAIAGLQALAAGRILFRGQRIDTQPPDRRVRAGIALVPEGRGIFARLTVAENLHLGTYVRSDRQAIRDDLERILCLLPRLRERLTQVAGTLSGGEQQMLAIGRALLSKPSLLLLDEPSMGLAPIVVETIYALIRTVAQSGMTILLVEQNAQLALDLADQAWVMEAGRITLSGTAAALREDTRVRSAYLGAEPA
ncbi:ABC transporter ATP-binding protein [Rhodocyclaceae bacterium SMB388]